MGKQTFVKSYCKPMGKTRRGKKCNCGKAHKTAIKIKKNALTNRPSDPAMSNQAFTASIVQYARIEKVPTSNWNVSGYGSKEVVGNCGK